jgi:tRNA G18 (ribose-2'-O)-methylase SpoU
MGHTNARSGGHTQTRPRSPLIVIASLVDKLPNLGGLARTCEVFNAGTLVVANLRVRKPSAHPCRYHHSVPAPRSS